MPCLHVLVAVTRKQTSAQTFPLVYKGICHSSTQQASSLVADEVNRAAHVDINKGDVASVLYQLGTACHGISVAPADLQQPGERQKSDSPVVGYADMQLIPSAPKAGQIPGQDKLCGLAQ